jgi:outer membrane protease
MMIQRYWVAALLMAFAAGFFAQEGHAYSLSISPSLGLLHGQGEEIVYRDGATDDKLSQLLWDCKPLVYLGVGLQYEWQKPAKPWGFFAGLRFKFGFPGESGVMEDRDWLSAAYPGWLTHYSVHDSETETAIVLDIDLGFSYTIAGRLLLRPFLSYGRLSVSWAAKDGSFLYPSGGTYEHFYLTGYGQVGTYEQTWHTVSLGVSLSGAFNRYFEADISLKLSPLVWCATEDNHIMRNLVIKGALQDGYSVEPRLVFSFTPTEVLKLSLEAAYRYTAGARGDTDYYEYGLLQGGIPKNIGAAAFSAFDVGIALQFKVLRRPGKDG